MIWVNVESSVQHHTCHICLGAVILGEKQQLPSLYLMTQMTLGVYINPCQMKTYSLNTLIPKTGSQRNL